MKFLTLAAILRGTLKPELITKKILENYLTDISGILDPSKITRDIERYLLD